jgi:hypothetical protein
VPGTRGIIDGVAGAGADGAVAGGRSCGWLVVAGICAGGFVAGEFVDCATTGLLNAMRRKRNAVRTRPLLVRVQPPTLRALFIAV